ncbi:MAG: glycosyltransferase family 39 protein, partial [Anaerolineae bacterium]|nr:glycosyltransferase family 39 protein [Anaerolineae bacterium]
ALALWAGAALAANPVHIALSRTARAYALLFVLSLLATYFFLRMLRRPRSRPVWIAFTLSSAAAYLTHYYSLFLPLAQLITLRSSRTRGLRKRWPAAQIMAGLPMALWSAQMVILNVASEGRFLGAHGDWLPAPTPRDLAITFPNLLAGFDGRWPAWMLVPGALAAVSGLALGLIAAARNTPIGRHLAVLAVLPPGLTFAYSQVRPAYLDRYFVIALPALIVVMVWGWGQIGHRGWRLALSALVIGSGCAVILSDVRAGRNEKTDWRGTALYVYRSLQPGDGLLLEREVSLDPFDYYFPDAADDLPLFTPDDPIPPSIARVWVIVPNPHMDLHRQGAFPAFDPFQPGDDPVGGWLLAHRSSIRVTRSFNGVWVVLVEAMEGGG